MRDAKRLYGFYDTLRDIHVRYFPDWRFGQLCHNFFRWLNEEGVDPFFAEESKMIEYLEEYSRIVHGYGSDRKITKRTKQYYSDGEYVWFYFIKGKMNPCGCGSNCYHHEYDGETIFCVCNACDADLYMIKPEYNEEKLKQGVWK